MLTTAVGFLVCFHFKLIFFNKSTIESSENKKDASVNKNDFFKKKYLKQKKRNMTKDGKKISNKFSVLIF